MTLLSDRGEVKWENYSKKNGLMFDVKKRFCKSPVFSFCIIVSTLCQSFCGFSKIFIPQFQMGFLKWDDTPGELDLILNPGIGCDNFIAREGSLLHIAIVLDSPVNYRSIKFRGWLKVFGMRLKRLVLRSQFVFM